MSASDRHPDLLAFVAGLPSASQATEVAHHLEVCDGCRGEERALRSLRRSLLKPPRPHPSAEELVALDERDEAAPPAGPLEAHVADCIECRADLEALARARRHRHPLEPADARSPASARPAATRGMRVGLGVAAVVVALLGAGFFLGRLGSPAAGRPPLTATLTAPTRGTAAPPVLRPGTAATLRVILPFGSPGGVYGSRLEDAHGRVVQSVETRMVKDGEILEVLLRAPAEPGEYRLVVRPPDVTAAPPIRYPVQVAGDPIEEPPAR